MSTLKEQKSQDSQPFSGDTHYKREDYRRKLPADTRCPGDVLTSEKYRGSLGDSPWTNTKIDDFMKKLFFRSNSPYRKN